MSKLDSVYLNILDQMFIGKDEHEIQDLAAEFREVVGQSSSLPTPSLLFLLLARLLGTEKDNCGRKLDLLHSIFNIPRNEAHPVRLLHLSFRDFHHNPTKVDKSPFHVNDKETHEKLLNNCLQLLSKSSCLKKHICNLGKSGSLRSGSDNRIIDIALIADVN